MFPNGKFVYGSTTLTFSFPPINKPAGLAREAQRNDSISLSGLKQTVYWRKDLLLSFQMDWIPAADTNAWQDWIDYAVAGGEFSYYKDATLAGFTVYTLEDKKLKLERNFIGYYKLSPSPTFRKVVGADQTGS